ncbi:MAG: ABC-2 family transporter protein [Firmicutes bacterium ADurb.Bin419]|nr:MAG: ABC-2 family transporter protein [Firmicutes bacterium ADurb.Bin419]
MRYEFKKLLGFREIWIGGLLLTAYLLFAVIMESSEAQDWSLIYQFITRFGSLLFPGFLIIGLSRVFCYEYSEHTDTLIHACKSGKKKAFHNKIGLSALYSVCIAIFFTGIALVIYMLPIGIGVSLPAIDQRYAVFSLSNVGIYSLQVLLMTAGGLSLAGFILMLSTIVRQGAVVMIISGAFYGTLMIYDTFIRHRAFSPIFQVIDSVLKYSPIDLINLNGYGCADIWDIQTNYLNGNVKASNLIIPLLVITIITAIELFIAYAVWTRRARK